MKLHENSELFEQLWALTAAMPEIDLDASIIEKDYWVTFALKRLSLEEKAIFKGGTSLFKAYRFLNRFSEDIDVTFTESIGSSAFKSMEKRVMKEPFIRIDDATQYKDKRSSDFRSIAYSYPRKNDKIISNLKPYIVYECYKYNLTFPWNMKEITSLIYDYLKKNKQDEIIKEHELEPFYLNVLSVKRTFFDKIFAVNESLIDQKNIAVYARHVYDLCKIIELDEMQLAYTSGEVKTLYKDFLEARIAMSGSSIDEKFDINSCNMMNCVNETFISGFTEFQDQLVFPNKKITIERVNEVISYITDYKYN
ncbi:MAG: nucleotidyl transferase AbiEii/AbiGii toxin family protein [Tenericutes bacterium]|nr:nucleotidyl transferase AbiEii/AbiGii toxin family protein [Mycoplasmatota bacterium]